MIRVPYMHSVPKEAIKRLGNWSHDSVDTYLGEGQSPVALLAAAGFLPSQEPYDQQYFLNRVEFFKEVSPETVEKLK